MLKIIKKSIMGLATSMFLLGSLSGIASAGYEQAVVTHNCNAKVLGIFDINFPIQTEINALVPDSVAPKQKYSITDATATVTIDKADVQTMKSLLGWNFVQGTVSLFEVKSDNKAQTINAASPSLNIPSMPVNYGEDLVFDVPASGSLTIGEFEAGDPANGDPSTINITAGNINAQFKKTGGTIFDPTINATCTPAAGNPALTQITIN